jgi:hypothetical protein
MEIRRVPRLGHDKKENRSLGQGVSRYPFDLLGKPYILDCFHEQPPFPPLLLTLSLISCCLWGRCLDAYELFSCVYSKFHFVLQDHYVGCMGSN